jgi:hypothetical protein
LTWKRRPLPDFIIIGAQKSGTSSLFAYLSQHPQLVPSFGKAVHFFDGGRDAGVDVHARGESWYRAQFPIAGRQGARAFEASPLYMFHPLVPARIHRLLPRVKLIALLRDPTERAISHYFHERRKGREPLQIMRALAAEDERLAPILRSEDYGNPAFRSYSYKSRGHYAEQLARYLTCFPREQILVLSSERFFLQPSETLRSVFEFVGVDPGVTISDLRARNVGSRSDVEPDVRHYLDDHFLSPNMALYELIGAEFGW